jgi:hypothetical protein
MDGEEGDVDANPASVKALRDSDGRAAPAKGI